MEPAGGIEPPTYWLRISCSTPELRSHYREEFYCRGDSSALLIQLAARGGNGCLHLSGENDGKGRSPEIIASLEVATSFEIDNPDWPWKMNPFFPGQAVNLLLNFIDNSFRMTGIIIKTVDGPAVGAINLLECFMKISRRFNHMTQGKSGAGIIEGVLA